MYKVIFNILLPHWYFTHELKILTHCPTDEFLWTWHFHLLHRFSHPLWALFCTSSTLTCSGDISVAIQWLITDRVRLRWWHFYLQWGCSYPVHGVSNWNVEVIYLSAGCDKSHVSNQLYVYINVSLCWLVSLWNAVAAVVLFSHVASLNKSSLFSSAVTEEQSLPHLAAVLRLRHCCLHLLLHAAGADPVRAGIH